MNPSPEQDPPAEPSTAPEATVAKRSLPPSQPDPLTQVQPRARWRDLVITLVIQLIAIAVTATVAWQVGGPAQWSKAWSAGMIAWLAAGLGYLILLKPVSALHFVGLVYLAILVRMGIGLGSVLIMRQIDTPLFGHDWVGYILAFYGIGLLLETILVARNLKTLQVH